MNILITGATGFIGMRLVERLLADGDRVYYLGRRESQRLQGRAVFQVWRGLEEPLLDQLPPIDAVIHLAGEPISQRWSDEVKKRIFESRVSGTRVLVSALGKLKEKPPVLVSASAIGYYGDRGDEVLAEKSGPGRGFLAEVCIGWEREAERAASFGMRVAMPRIATVIGKDGGALEKMLPPFRLGLGGQFGSGRQWISWIHLDDLVDLLLFCARDKRASGPLNAGSPEPLRNADFTSELAKAVHRPAIIPVPKFALRIALGEMSSFLFDSIRVEPKATLQAGFNFRHPQLGEALKSVLS